MAWTPPTIDDFLLRFPQFKGYDPALVQVILDDSNMRVDEGAWIEHDKTPASLNLTAHRLLTTPGAAPVDDGSGSGGGGGSSGSSGTEGAIKRRKVGDVEVEYETKSDFISDAGSGGSKMGPLAGFQVTPYGRAYLYLMKLNFPAVRVVYR